MASSFELIQPLADSSQLVWGTVASFLPQLVIAVAVFLIGLLVGSLVGKGVYHLVRHLRLDSMLRATGVHHALKKADIDFSASRFLGSLFNWFVAIVFLVLALDILGLEQLNQFLNQVLFYIPNVFVAVVVLMIASVVSGFVQKIVVGSAKAAGIEVANFLGSVAKWAIWIFAILLALTQLQIGQQFLYTLFTGIVAMFAIAGGIAFGLGGKDAAHRTVEHFSKSIQRHKVSEKEEHHN